MVQIEFSNLGTGISCVNENSSGINSLIIQAIKIISKDEIPKFRINMILLRHENIVINKRLDHKIVVNKEYKLNIISTLSLPFPPCHRFDS